jgi:hypothetical protein
MLSCLSFCFRQAVLKIYSGKKFRIEVGGQSLVASMAKGNQVVIDC